MTTKEKKKDFTDDVRESANKIWLAGLGALSLAEEEGSKLFKRLVKEGEGFEKRSKKRFKKVQDQFEDRVEEARDAAEETWEKLGSTFDERVATTLKRLGVPSRMEIQKLTKRVEELTVKVDQLKPKAPARRTKTA